MTDVRRKMFITGGSRGLGAGIVRAAAESGYDIAFTYQHRAENAREVIEQVHALSPKARCLAYQLDVRDSAAVDQVGDAVLDEFENVDVVVNNAAITNAGLAFSTSDEDWGNVLTTNLTGSFYVARRFLSAFLANGGGRFIFMSSIAAGGMSGDAAYSASKAGMLGLSGALSKEYGRKGITSNALLLSLFETEMTQRELSQQNRDYFERHCPVGRIGQISDVTSAVLYLSSEAASFVNGQEIGINGGLDWLH